MQITTPLIKRYIDAYDFVYAGGLILQASVDTAAGDTIQWETERLVIKTVAKPNPSDPSIMIPAETTVYFLSQMLSYRHSVLEFTDLTPEQKLDFQQAAGTRH